MPSVAKNTMLTQPFDIDTIVRQVLADLDARNTSARGASPVVTNTTPVKTLPQNTLPQAVGQTKATLQLLDSLVTLASLEGRLDGVQEIVISPKAIVTPSVRDLLYKKEIKLMSVQNESPGRSASSAATIAPRKSNANAGTTAVWLALHQLKREPETLLGFLQGQANFIRELFGCIIETTQAAAKQLAESDSLRAIIVTNHSAAALVSANRHEAIRAILGDNPEQTSQDAALVGANLLVLHADRLGAYRMKETARAFLRETKNKRDNNENR